MITYSLLNQLAEKHDVTVTWCRAHIGLHGNEAADKLAKSAANSSSLMLKSIPTSPSVWKHISSIHRSSNRQADLVSFLQSSNTTNLLAPAIINSDMSKTLNELNLTDSRLLTNFLANRYPLKSFLFKIGAIPDNTCRYCSLDSESNHHILCHCEALWRERNKHFFHFFIPIPHKIDARAILKFLHTIDFHALEFM